MMSAVTLFAGYYPLDDIPASNDAETRTPWVRRLIPEKLDGPTLVSRRGHAVESNSSDQAVNPSK